jgi:hypothetical protein
VLLTAAAAAAAAAARDHGLLIPSSIIGVFAVDVSTGSCV